MSEIEPDIHSFVAAVNLEGISYFELSAKSGEINPGQSDGFPEEGYDVQPEFRLQLAKNETDAKFLVRIRTSIDAEPGIVVVDAGVEYSVEDFHFDLISDDLLVEFTNKVALFALIPYIRQAVEDLTMKVFRVPLTMPMYRQGEMIFAASN